MTEVNEKFLEAAMDYVTRTPRIEPILSAKHLLREPGHPEKMPYSKPRILTEEEVKTIFSMEECNNAVGNK